MSELRPRSRSRRIAAAARHGRLPRSNAWATLLKWVAAVSAVALVSGISVGAIAVGQLQNNIDTFVIDRGDEEAPPPIAPMEDGFTILIVGSDTREGQDGIGGHVGSTLNDVNMLLRVSPGGERAVAVSIPRDLVVPVPSCPSENGGMLSAMSAQPINSVLSHGGMGCVVLTVEQLTGMRIDYAGMITFKGVIEMSNAVGGVPVCITAPINDKDAELYLDKAGTHTLEGEQALAFLRSRKGVGDGSDLGRISSQQVFLSSLVRTLKSSETLGDISKVYPLARAATENMTLSQSFAQIDTLLSIALALKDVPLDEVVFVQYPGTTGVGGVYSGKVAPITAQADALFEYIRNDKPFALDENAIRQGATKDPSAEGGDGETPEPTETAEPGGDTPDVLQGIKGQTAADQTCSVAY